MQLKFYIGESSHIHQFTRLHKAAQQNKSKSNIMMVVNLANMVQPVSNCYIQLVFGTYTHM